MIKTTVGGALDAFSALTRISEENRLPYKPAWQIARLLNRLKAIVRDFQATSLKLFRDSGGVEHGDDVVKLEGPVRAKDESDEAWQARQAAWQRAIVELNEQLQALKREPVEIDAQPIPLALFEDDPKAAPERRMKFSPNDLAKAAAFLQE